MKPAIQESCHLILSLSSFFCSCRRRLLHRESGQLRGGSSLCAIKVQTQLSWHVRGRPDGCRSCVANRCLTDDDAVITAVIESFHTAVSHWSNWYGVRGFHLALDCRPFCYCIGEDTERR